MHMTRNAITVTDVSVVPGVSWNIVVCGASPGKLRLGPCSYAKPELSGAALPLASAICLALFG